jgi:YNFM family putative membrane transporter
MLAGFCAFLNLFVTQPIEPYLEGVFHASKAHVSMTVTASTLGVALAAPLAGVIADRLGRKRVIVWSAGLLGLTTLLSASAAGLNWLIFWRFLQGLVTPGVFGVTVAYVNDEWPPHRAGAGAGYYLSGTITGGVIGRLSAGFIAQYFGWQWIFIAVGTLILLISALIQRTLPAERVFRPGISARNTAGETGPGILQAGIAHLINGRLFATFVVGFCVLSTMLDLFTYAAFHLAAPPYSLQPGALGLIFIVYLVGGIISPTAGKAIDRYGQRPVVVASATLTILGALITLLPSIWAVVAGLTLASSGLFISQSSGLSHVGVAARSHRALAVGIYVSFYYIGGSVGSTGPSWLWDGWRWPGCVAAAIAIQVVLALTVWFGWKARETSNTPAIT